MAARKSYTVNTTAKNYRLNVRKEPRSDAEIMARLSYGEKVKIDPKTETPDGWFALESGGYVMAQYLK